MFQKQTFVFNDDIFIQLILTYTVSIVGMFIEFWASNAPSALIRLNTVYVC